MRIDSTNIKELFDYRDGQLIWRIRPALQYPIGSTAGAYHASDGYWQIGYKGKTYSAHRLIFLWHHGYIPQIVDHIDRDKLNNKIENLRGSCKSRNAINSDEIKGEIGYRGVSINRTANPPTYSARIRKDYSYINLGYYKTPEEASEAYQKARKELFPGVFN